MNAKNLKKNSNEKVTGCYGVANKVVDNLMIIMDENMYKLNNAMCILKVDYTDMLGTFELYNVHKVIDSYGPMVITEPLFPIEDEDTKNQTVTHVGGLYFPNKSILESQWFKDGLNLIKEDPNNLLDYLEVLYGESIDKHILHVGTTLENANAMDVVDIEHIINDEKMSILSGDVNKASTLFANSAKDKTDDVYCEYLDNLNREW